MRLDLDRDRSRHLGFDMTHPKTLKEFIERMERNYYTEGEGENAVTMIPCPFCAAPDFMHYVPATAREVEKQTHTCNECGRSSRLVFHDDGSQIVQVGGEDQPDYLIMRYRRMS
jgi:hypothetical protein